MRHIKPQSALVYSANSQIGSQALLGISIGVGFRLSDPRVLVHETAVWEALKSAEQSVPLFESGLPKRHAEWLLAGHARHTCKSAAQRRFVEWTSAVELDGVKKEISCLAPPDANSTAHLAIDHKHAASGPAMENPFGIRSEAPPLQLLRTLGVSPAPLAAMGGIGSDWPERMQWQPAFGSSAEAMAKDGTHMGWPAHVDLRFFQQASPDQWKRDASWSMGARFELHGFGPDADSCVGHLPRLVPVTLATRRDGNDVERLALTQQTVWFLPDRDVGVMWWNGAAMLDYVLDDSLTKLVVAFRDETEAIETDGIMEFAERRANIDHVSPMKHDDSPLMPATANGWTWDTFHDADDHPRFGPPLRSYEDIRSRLEHSRLQLGQAQEGYERLQEFRRSNEDATVSAALPVSPDNEDWRLRLQRATSAELRDVTIRHADLSALRFDAWSLEDVRFENCKLDNSEWRNCRFRNVYATDCSFVGMHMSEGCWTVGAISRSNLEHSEWQNVTLEKINLEDCQLGGLRVVGGTWSRISAQGGGGGRGVMRDVEWNGINWCKVDAPDWSLTHMRVNGLGLVDCHMSRLQVSQCTLLKLSALSTDLVGSQWTDSLFTFAVFSQDTSLKLASLTECVFKSSSWQDLHAEGLKVDYCTFVQLNAQRVGAKASRWTHTVLDRMNGTHACFSHASFDRCSLKDAMLYGADFRHSQMSNCNLIQAKTSWIQPPEAGAWRNNLNAGQLNVPWRSK